MRSRLIALAALSLFGVTAASAADLVWEVENPFRLFKTPQAFALHEAAYKAVRGDAGKPQPADIIWRTERRLNDPDCKDRSSPDNCGATAGPRFQQSRLGWAAQTLAAVCYESAGNPRRYPAQCDRKYSWGSAKEDTILPEAHTVQISLSPERLAEAGAGDCQWRWQSRAAPGKSESRKLACKSKLTIARVPYSMDRTRSGVAVTVKLPDGSELSDSEVVVDDVFIVALGDSFASGESNPDRPVTFSAVRETLYDPQMQRDELAARKPHAEPAYGVAAADPAVNPKVLPRRLLADEEKQLYFKAGSREFRDSFEQRSARWFSADCHRSQYGYPFRVGIQLALENRHRAVTLVSLACSGAEVGPGLFLEMPSREGASATVRPQFDQLSELTCRDGAAGLSRSAQYTIPMYKHGSTAITMTTLTQRWCPPERRKRTPDVVLLSIGGNDVGFGGLVAYSITESAADLAPIAGLVGSELRYPPQIAQTYLAALDKRMNAVKDALHDGFGVEPARVVENAYEPVQYDENGKLCGSQPLLGMDVHSKLRLSQERLAETATFFQDFVNRMQCISGGGRGRNCPAGLATGRGTGFTLVTEHQTKFARRGICARDPKSAMIDGLNMAMPRKSPATDEFKPFNPAYALPYGAHWRLVRTPNDAFLTANTHREGISQFDILQPAYAALYSGAMHPTAEGHSIVADTMVKYAREVLAARAHPHIEVKPVTTGARD
jgi:lysophospholipase L1-like esterase